MKTLDIDSITLTMGSHENAEDGFCLLEAVAYIAGEPWSDKPQCVSPVIASFFRSYNDLAKDEVRQSLKQYIPRLVGTRGSDTLERRRSLIAVDWLVRVHTPAWLRYVELTDHANALASLPEITAVPLLPSIQAKVNDAATAARIARDAARAEAYDMARAVSRVVAKVVVWEDIKDAAVDATWAAAWSAASSGSYSQPTKDELQATIPALIERMLTATEESSQ